jgi:hypothetical protein
VIVVDVGGDVVAREKEECKRGATERHDAKRSQRRHKPTTATNRGDARFVAETHLRHPQPLRHLNMKRWSVS